MSESTNGLHAAVERAATAAATARPEFGAFFLARFLDLDISYDDEAGTCTRSLLRPGRRIVHLESRLTDNDDRPVAFATGSWHRLPAPEQAQPRT